MKIINVMDLSKDKVVYFFTIHWGSPEMVTSGGIYDCSTLDGFAAVNQEGQIIGLITYKVRGK